MTPPNVNKASNESVRIKKVKLVSKLGGAAVLTTI